MIGIGWARDERVWRPDIIYALPDSIIPYGCGIQGSLPLTYYSFPILYGIPDTSVRSVLYLGHTHTAQIDARKINPFNSSRIHHGFAQSTTFEADSLDL